MKPIYMYAIYRIREVKFKTMYHDPQTDKYEKTLIAYAFSEKSAKRIRKEYGELLRKDAEYEKNNKYYKPFEVHEDEDWDGTYNGYSVDKQSWFEYKKITYSKIEIGLFK